MSAVRLRLVRKSSPEPVALHDRAMADLQYIRETMERSGSFTAVPGWGGVGMGVVALGAAGVAHAQATPHRWLMVWLAAAVLSFAFAVAAMVRKSRAVGSPLLSGPGRKFALSFLPPVLVGALLTGALVRTGQFELLPGTWLLLYGTAVVTGGAFSVRVVPLMGVGFLLVGGATLFVPFAWGDLFMALGFGVLHLVFGVLIARRYGG